MIFIFNSMAYSEKIVCDIPDGFNIFEDNVFYFTNSKGTKEIPFFRLAEIKIKKSVEEKAKHRRQYRKEYNKRPQVVKKNRERMLNPDNIKKRKEYNQRPDVKERKTLQAKQARQVKRLMKEEYGRLYRELEKRVKTQSNGKSEEPQSSSSSNEESDEEEMK